MGRKNWGERIGRKMLIVSDVIFILCGVAILITAIISHAEVKDMQDRTDLLSVMNIDTYLVVAIFVGAAAIIGALLGLISVLKRYKRLLVFSVIVMFIVFVVQIVMGSLLLSAKTSEVYDAFREDSAAGYARREAFQQDMQCCGWNYITEEFFPERVACIARHPTFTETCASALETFLDKWAQPAGIVLIVFSILAFIALVASMLVVFSSRTVKEDFFENPFSF